MRKLLELLGHVALMPVCLGAVLDEALGAESKSVRSIESLRAAEQAEGFTEFEGFEEITAQTGAFSPSTGDSIVGPALYVRAYFERFDGADPAGPGTNPRGMLIFRTMTGRFVVRFLDWPGAQ
jgi:hypothetical protein